MKVDVLLGLQWGDEGKGKIVDYLAPKYRVIARFQGGPNAGHTLEFDGIKHVLHQIPSGIFRSDAKNVIGNGVVLDPVVFRREIAALDKFKLDVKKNLFISKKAQVILPTHRLLDTVYEQAKGENKIGSTLRGIGPAYQDKVARQGIRVGDILSDRFGDKYQNLANKHVAILNEHAHHFDLASLEKEFFEAVDFMRQFAIVDSEYLINQSLHSHESVLAEGAQGSLLDIDFGSYPFVTSSNTMTAGACTGLGVAPRQIGEVFGVFKAYCTRVGGGPFPTELHGAEGERLRKQGNEYGATTGRPRRCGWLDLPALKYAIMLNGVTQLVMMKADVLNDFERINVCTHYKYKDGTVNDQFPYDLLEIEIEPVYREFTGWQTSLKDASLFEQLPHELTSYIDFIERETGLPITFLSTGPDRRTTVRREMIVD